MQKIMFNDRYGLTDAVIEGRKTMTRRLIPDEFFGLTWDTRGDTLVYENEYGDFIDVRHSTYTRYKVGEVVAVAQSYGQVYHHYGLETMDMVVSGMKTSAGWKNKMFVKAELVPHQIRITRIRCERLQDISDEDCMKEGVVAMADFKTRGCSRKLFALPRCEYAQIFNTPRQAFAALIDKVSGRGTWDRNPWVAVYEFELVK